VGFCSRGLECGFIISINNERNLNLPRITVRICSFFVWASRSDPNSLELSFFQSRRHYNNDQLPRALLTVKEIYKSSFPMNLTMAADQASDQLPMHETWLKISLPRSHCDQCCEKSVETTVYRCPKCGKQYCMCCWQRKPREDDGQHVCGQSDATSPCRTTRAKSLPLNTRGVSNHPSGNESLLRIRTTGAICDQCRKTCFETTVYRCKQETCMEQYCTACWQLQSRDDDGQHICNRRHGVRMKNQTTQEKPVKANGVVDVTSLKRNRDSTNVDGEDDYIEMGTKIAKVTSIAKQTRASKKQRKDGDQVPDDRTDSPHSNANARADVHDPLHKQ